MSDQNIENESPPINCKVVLIGKTSVGKTSIISRYTTNTFKENLMTTPGGNFLTKNVFLEEEKKTINIFHYF